jgi:hypothetical protein
LLGFLLIGPWKALVCGMLTPWRAGNQAPRTSKHPRMGAQFCFNSSYVHILCSRYERTTERMAPDRLPPQPPPSVPSQQSPRLLFSVLPS